MIGEPDRDLGKIAVFYLARGADQDAIAKFHNFRHSYCRFPAGIDHDLFIILKGFINQQSLDAALDVFQGLRYSPIYTADDSFDLGAYFVAAGRVESEHVCFLNTTSEIAGADWLLKLAINHALPGIGLVGCSGSYEAPQHPDIENKAFPNPHIRSTAFMLRRDRFLAMSVKNQVASKLDVYLLEHGLFSITRQIQAQHLQTLVVGKDGRGYEPPWWPVSQTFRQGSQANLLVHDNQSRAYDKASIGEKRFLFKLAWGDGALRWDDYDASRAG